MSTPLEDAAEVFRIRIRACDAARVRVREAEATLRELEALREEAKKTLLRVAAENEVSDGSP